jgi:hypothetical protein
MPRQGAVTLSHLIAPVLALIFPLRTQGRLRRRQIDGRAWRHALVTDGRFRSGPSFRSTPGARRRSIHRQRRGASGRRDEPWAESSYNPSMNWILIDRGSAMCQDSPIVTFAMTERTLFLEQGKGDLPCPDGSVGQALSFHKRRPHCVRTGTLRPIRRSGRCESPPAVHRAHGPS